MTTLQALSTADLTAELQRREQDQAKLRARREALMTELTKINTELEGHGAKPAKRSRTTPRAKNAMSLHDALAVAVTVGTTVSPKEATQAVLAAGYATKAKSFGVQVAGRLAKDDRFERAERGLYKRIK